MNSNNILVIDSSTATLQLALAFEGDRLVKKAVEAGHSHGQIIYRQIELLLASAQIKVNQLEGVIVNTGPGSFTGLRIGLAAAKAIAVVNNIPVVALHLFEIASNILRESKEEYKVIVPFKKDAFFGYDCPFDMFSVERISVENTESVLQEPDTACISKETALSFESNYDKQITCIAYDVSDLLRFGKSKLDNKEHADLATLEPLYVQKSQAEINFDLRNNK